MALGKSHRSFKNLKDAKWRVPRKRGPLRILVLNLQGLPVLYYDAEDGSVRKADDRECALAAEMAREVYNYMRSYRHKEPSRVAFFYEDEVVTIERSDPFILLITWPKSAIDFVSSNQTYFRRLDLTLREELT